MHKGKYYEGLEIDPMKFENLEEKRVIHQFENKTNHLDLDKLKNKKAMNEVR